MEQYWMPKEQDSENLRKCLDNYKAERIFIRLMGSFGGETKVSESLENRALDIQMDSSELSVLVDGSEVFRFPLNDYKKGFSLEYERVDGAGVIMTSSTGLNPDDPKLPKPRKSILKINLDNYFMEITFQGKVPLKFHSWWKEPHWKYWTVDK